MAATTRADAAAIGLSGLCILHCLALPIVASFMPVIGAVADAEWLHRALVICALPVSTYAISRTKPGPDRGIFIAGVLVGAGILVAGAFVEAFHDHETLLTVCGALILSSAHIFRWQRHRSAQSEAFPPNEHL